MIRATLTTIAVLTTSAAAGPAFLGGAVDAAADAAPATVIAVAAAAAPQHAVTVSGTGVATYPAFSPSIARYGITTTAATGGTVTVAAATDDPAGRVRVNGRTLTGAGTTLSGLVPGDEIAVFFEDSAGTSRHSFIYLPAGFPVLERTTPDPAPGALQPGHVLLTLSQWVRPTPPALDYYETAVDVNGVPVFARRTAHSMDLNRQPDGGLTVFRRSATASGEDLVLLDDQLEPVATRRAVGLDNTDGHDAIVQPDGTVWFMSYEPRNSDGSGPVDAIIQRVDPDGTVGFEWSSETYQSTDAVRAVPDYAHVNSMQIMSDGDLLVSFRHFSSVFKIHPVPGPGIDTGEVVWKLGGRDSDFTFPVGDVGPCAQHTARELPNGNIQMFDNGSATFTTSWCVDQADPTGIPVERVQTRVVEFALDEGTGTASVVNSYAPGSGTPDRFFAIFAGSSQFQPNGNTLIGWAAETKALASEIDPAGDLLWQIRDPRPTTDFRYFTYRAAKTTVPDVTAPVVGVTSPPDGTTYVEGATVRTDFGCTDRGGSSLQNCSGPATLDTSSPGTRIATFTATDSAGRTSAVTRTYRVLAATGVDLAVQKAGSRAWVGQDVVGTAGSQQVRSTLPAAGKRAKAVVRVRNDGATPASLSLQVRTRGKSFQLLRPRSSTLTTPVLLPGQTWTVRLVVVRRASASRGDRMTVTVTAMSAQTPVRADTVSWQVRATGG